jgi:hypothetical protein
MNLGDYLASQNLFILISVVVVAIVALLMFLRKPKNRHPMDNPAGRAAEERRARENAQGVTDIPPTRR